MYAFGTYLNSSKIIAKLRKITSPSSLIFLLAKGCKEIINA